MKPTPLVSALGLRSLRTYAAAARHLHFTKAAEELNVTTAAISHQVRELESQLGVSLFERRGKTLRLSAEGEIMRQATEKAIAALEGGIERLRARRSGDQVRVSASPSMAARWLVPRLERFLAHHQQADIRVDVSYTETDFAQEATDLSIRYGAPQGVQAQVDRLFVASVFPVCSPRLLGAHWPLRKPSDLLQYKLIHVDWPDSRGQWPSWQSWMQAAQVPDMGVQPGLHFQQTSLAIDAAIAGQGIALGEASMVQDDLASGRLIKPLQAELPVQAAWAYYLLTNPTTQDQPMVRAFRQWLLHEAAQAGTP